jgi:hypothetical protein
MGEREMEKVIRGTKERVKRDREREMEKERWGKRVGKSDMGKKKWCRKVVRETSGIGGATLQLLALQYISVPSTCQLPQTILSKHSKVCV